jgi:hypothetical protein
MQVGYDTKIVPFSIAFRWKSFSIFQSVSSFCLMNLRVPSHDDLLERHENSKVFVATRERRNEEKFS